MKSHRQTPIPSFGLEAWLEATRIILPLREVSVRADVAAGFASVDVDMLFEQDNREALDCSFVFPLPSAAAVRRCEMHVNGRVVAARVEERSQAEKLYKKAKHEGRRAALAAQERENLFSLELGNLQPGDQILIRFAYIEPVQRQKEQFRLRFPLNAGIRYCPGTPLLRPNRGGGILEDTDRVPDASRISPPRIESGHSDAAGIDIAVRLRGGLQEASAASSPSHMVMVRMEGGDLLATLAGGHHVPDRDFVLLWSGQANASVCASAWLDGKSRGILELRLPESAEVSGEDGRDIYFLLDRSASMQGANWRGACKALAAFPEKVPATARIWLSLFDTLVRDYSEAPVPAREVDFGVDGEKIHRIGANGGTCIKEALEHAALKILKHSTARSAAVVLITDGQVGNELETLEAARACGCPVHVLGIAMGVSDALGALADETGGRAVFLSPGEDLAGAVERFAPVLGNPQVACISMPEGWQTVDGRGIGDAVPGDTVVVAVSGPPDAGSLVLSGRAADGSDWMIETGVRRLDVAGAVWARAKIRHLDRRGDPEALGLAKEYNLLSANSAFVAWDVEEEVAIARREIIQPSLDPSLDDGVLYCSVHEPVLLRCHAPRRSALPARLEEKLVDFVREFREWLDSLHGPDLIGGEGRRILARIEEILAERDGDLAEELQYLVVRLAEVLGERRRLIEEELRKLHGIDRFRDFCGELLEQMEKSKRPAQKGSKI